MTTMYVLVAALIFIAGLFAAIVQRTGERDEARDEIARTNREAAGLATDDDHVAKRWVDLGAHATWVALGCNQPDQYAACEEIAKAVLRSVLPIRDATLVAQINELDQENMRLHDALTMEQIAAGTVHIPHLRAVPTQRDSEWPAIVRAVEGES